MFVSWQRDSKVAQSYEQNRVGSQISRTPHSLVGWWPLKHLRSYWAMSHTHRYYDVLIRNAGTITLASQTVALLIPESASSLPPTACMWLQVPCLHLQVSSPSFLLAVHLQTQTLVLLKQQAACPQVEFSGGRSLLLEIFELGVSLKCDGDLIVWVENVGSLLLDIFFTTIDSLSEINFVYESVFHRCFDLFSALEILSSLWSYFGFVILNSFI